MDDRRRSERSRDASDPRVLGSWKLSPWSRTPLRCLQGCASAKHAPGARVAHRVPKASFDGVLWPLLTALCPKTIEKTLCGSLLLRIKSPLLYQLS